MHTGAPYFRILLSLSNARQFYFTILRQVESAVSVTQWVI
jgi:hypothetical protein